MRQRVNPASHGHVSDQGSDQGLQGADLEAGAAPIAQEGILSNVFGT